MSCGVGLRSDDLPAKSAYSTCERPVAARRQCATALSIRRRNTVTGPVRTDGPFAIDTNGRQPVRPAAERRSPTSTHASRLESSATPASASMIAAGAASRSTRSSRVSTSVASDPFVDEHEERPAPNAIARIAFEAKPRRRRANPASIRARSFVDAGASRERERRASTS